MPQKGIEKQVPSDQRSRGKNREHPEGEANIRNQQEQGEQPVPPPKKSSKG